VADAQATDFDVVIVGGGPAGSAAALWCARHGLRVILLERVQFPRHRPGETLPPGIEPIFAQLGVAGAVLAAGFTRHLGTWVSWGEERRFDRFGGDEAGAWQGYQAPRAELDRLLLDAASAAGVALRQPCRSLRPTMVRGRVTGVLAEDGPIRARWVIDASGSAHWLARHLKLPLQFASPRLVARYGYARGSCPERDDAPAIVADETGWTWTARIAPGSYHWMRLSLVDSDPWRDRPPPAFAQLVPAGRPRGADVTWRIVSRPAGPGYVCVGDAAAVLDPASSHGVLRALMSGMMAAHVIAQACTGTASEAAVTDTFTAWLRTLFEDDVTGLRRLYQSLPSPPVWVSGPA
jgi:flavin-dependent dehydrogenase